MSIAELFEHLIDCYNELHALYVTEFGEDADGDSSSKLMTRHRDVIDAVDDLYFKYNTLHNKFMAKLLQRHVQMNAHLTEKLDKYKLLVEKAWDKTMDNASDILRLFNAHPDVFDPPLSKNDELFAMAGSSRLVGASGAVVFLQLSDVGQRVYRDKLININNNNNNNNKGDASSSSSSCKPTVAVKCIYPCLFRDGAATKLHAHEIMKHVQHIAHKQHHANVSAPASASASASDVPSSIDRYLRTMHTRQVPLVAQHFGRHLQDVLVCVLRMLFGKGFQYVVDVWGLGTLPAPIIVMERMDMSLVQFLKACQLRETHISYGTLLRIFAGVIIGHGELKTLGAVHIDLRPDNVLIKVDPATQAVLHAKLTDFGLVRLFAHGNTGLSVGLSEYKVSDNVVSTKYLGCDPSTGKLPREDTEEMQMTRIRRLLMYVLIMASEYNICSEKEKRLEYSDVAWAKASTYHADVVSTFPLANLMDNIRGIEQSKKQELLSIYQFDIGLSLAALEQKCKDLVKDLGAQA